MRVACPDAVLFSTACIARHQRDNSGHRLAVHFLHTEIRNTAQFSDQGLGNHQDNWEILIRMASHRPSSMPDRMMAECLMLACSPRCSFPDAEIRLDAFWGQPRELLHSVSHSGRTQEISDRSSWPPLEPRTILRPGQSRDRPYYLQRTSTCLEGR